MMRCCDRLGGRVSESTPNKDRAAGSMQKEIQNNSGYKKKLLCMSSKGILIANRADVKMKVGTSSQVHPDSEEPWPMPIAELGIGSCIGRKASKFEGSSI